jgi:hypothetical protein
VLEDNVIHGAAADGVVFRDETRGVVAGGAIRDSERAGIRVGKDSIVRISRVEMGGNRGPGIDIAPNKVTPNGDEKVGNRDLDWPEQLVWKPTTGKVSGQACAGCLVEGFDVEGGSREGNPVNGEGFEFRESVRAAADGSFEWPRGRITCDEARETTFTATRDDPVPHTSEFSESPTCAPELFSYSFGEMKVDFDGAAHANRPHVAHTMVGGTACGTDPTKAVWSVRHRDGFGDFNQRLDFAPENPIQYRVYRFELNGAETARVAIRLGITATTASLAVTQSGDIINLTTSPTPPQVPLTKTPVAGCP